MKKLYKMMSVVMMVLFGAVLLVSCDEDIYVGSSLQGTWQGNLYSYAVTRRGQTITYPSVKSEVSFGANPFRIRKGTGVWVDHFAGSAPWQYSVDHFTWTVADGVITLRFWSDGFVTSITDYSISGNYFTGYIDLGGQDGYQPFELYKVSDENIWNSYNDGWYGNGGYMYGWDYYRDYYNGGYYAPATRADSATTQVPLRHFGKIKE